MRTRPEAEIQLREKINVNYTQYVTLHMGKRLIVSGVSLRDLEKPLSYLEYEANCLSYFFLNLILEPQ